MKTTRVLAAAVVLVSTMSTTSSAQLPRLLPECFGDLATIAGTDGDDVLAGTPDRDVIAGLEGNDVIRGLEGNDALCGGSGDDEIDGDAGVDAIAVGRGADTARGGAGTDIVVEFSSDSCGPCLPTDPTSRDHSSDRMLGGTGDDGSTRRAGTTSWPGAPAATGLCTSGGSRRR
jgi:hypothetical protein